MNEGAGLTPAMEAELSNGKDFDYDYKQLGEQDEDKPEHERVEGRPE